MSGVPIVLEAAGLRVLVVGGGGVAARKVATFVTAGALVRLIAPSVVETIRDLARSGRIEWQQRAYGATDIGDAQLVITATVAADVNAAVAADAIAAGRLVNVADASAAGSFTMMAAHRSGGLVVGVSAAGVPGAAARIRDAIARRFDDRYGRALDGLAAIRRSMVDRGARDEWRAIAGDLIDGEFCESVEQGTLDARAAAWR